MNGTEAAVLELDLGLAHIQQILPEPKLTRRGDMKHISSDKGAYAVLVQLAHSVSFARGGLRHRFAPGLYVYAGSARGPGGLKARLSRHLASEKAKRWHIDELTSEALDMAALAIPGGDECLIIERLSAAENFAVALPGFGSSDCRHCDAHLLRFVPAT